MKNRLLFWMTYLLFWTCFAEMAFRTVLNNPYTNDNSIVQKINIYPPNIDYKLSRRFIDPMEHTVSLRTGSRSYILPSFQHETPDKTILFLGGSTTECAAVQEDLRFPALVSTLLSKNGYAINTLNLARSGSTTHDSINSFLNHGIIDNPDIVVLMHAVNDIGVLCRSPHYAARLSQPLHKRRVREWIKQRASHYFYLIAHSRYIYDYLTSLDIGFKPNTQRAKTCTDVSLKDYAKRLKMFVALSRISGATPILMTQPSSTYRTDMTPQWLNDSLQSKANNVIRDLSKSEDVLLIDLEQLITTSYPDYWKPMNFFYDGIHLTDHGSTVYAELIVNSLLQSKVLERNMLPGHKDA